MPELPEVETIKLQLKNKILGKKILKTEALTSKIINIPIAAFIKDTQGAAFKDITRRAKILILELSNGVYLLVHLKLSGHLIYQKEKAKNSKYAHIIFHLSGGGKLVFDDFRKFGYVKSIKNKEELDKLLKEENFGPEALSQDFTLEKFKESLAKKPKSPIKPLLMDQTFLAGLGNVYAQEACFYAKISPKRKVKTLKDSEIKNLYKAIREILISAIKKRGTSVDAYLDAKGKQGEFQNYLKVYGREGKACFRCGAKIKKIVMGSRGTSYCPKCQK